MSASKFIKEHWKLAVASATMVAGYTINSTNPDGITSATGALMSYGSFYSMLLVFNSERPKDCPVDFSRSIKKQPILSSAFLAITLIAGYTNTRDPVTVRDIIEHQTHAPK